MELSTSTNLCAFQRGRARLPVTFSIDECAKAGYRVLDMNFCIAMNPDSPMRGEAWEEYVQFIGKYAAERGIRFVQSHLPYYDPGKGIDPTMEELIRRSIIGSAMLGVRWCVTHPFTDHTVGEDAARQQEANVRYYAAHVAAARTHGTGIALENDFTGRQGYLYCADVAELSRLVDAFAEPEYVGACYDFGHGNLMPGSHREKLRCLGHRLRALHVHDNHGQADEHLLPLYGSIDWRECMSALAELDWQGDLTFEAQEFGRYLPAEMKHLAVEQSVQVGRYLIQLFEEAQRERRI